MDRFTWGIAIGAVLLILAALGSVLLLQPRTGTVDLSRPEGVVRAYYAALESGRAERAWDLLSASAQGSTTREEFIQRATSYRPGREGRIATERVEIEGDTAYVHLSRTYGGPSLFGPQGRTESITVRLDRAAGGWRITVPPEPYLIAFPRGPVPAATPPGPPATVSATVTALPTPTAATRS